MRNFILIILILCVSTVKSQTQEDVNNFLEIFKSEIKNYDFGKIEEHFNDGYFKTFNESEYFDGNTEVGITSIFQSSYGKTDNEVRKIIKDYFEQHKKLNTQRKQIARKMNDFEFIKSFLKIRIYSKNQRTLYEDNNAIINSNINDLISVVVLDLPDGIGSLNKTYLKDWKKTENEVYNTAKENTLSSLTQNFEKAETFPTGEEIYLLASDSNLFITSSILNIKQFNIPIGKFGTIISIPNNTVIVALPINDKEKIESYGQNFYGLSNYMYQSSETKPLSDKIFWFDGEKYFEIQFLEQYQKLAFPIEMQEYFEKK